MNKDIVLIPGALTTPQLWKHQEAYLQSKANLYYLDVLNCDSITEMATRFIPQAPKKFTLIGFSMGGFIALELIKLIPHQIEKLIFVNSSARAISDKGRLERERALDLINKGKFDFLIKLMFKNSIFNTCKKSTLLPFIEQMAIQVGDANYTKQLNAILNKPDHSPLLLEINCPTLLLASKGDSVMPNERSEHMAQHIKNSELIYLEQCGHMAMLEQPDLFNQKISGWI